MTKYHNKKTTVNGITFDSKLEAARYSELLVLERGGFISALSCQPKFMLQDGFEYDGKKERAIYYIGDFQYLDNDTDKWVIEDVKSPATRTAVYLVKRKLFLAKYGKRYRFEEVAA